jgi:DNA polymerase-3 subunit delta
MSNCLILLGDDEYSKEEFIKKEISSKVDPSWESFNVVTFNSEEIKSENIDKIIEACTSLPFGPGNKIVIVNNIKSEKSKDSDEDNEKSTKKKNILESEELLKLLQKGLFDNVYLILSCISIDERKSITKKIISFCEKKIFNIPEAWNLLKVLTPWVEDCFRKKGKRIEKAGAEHIVLATSGDKYKIINEVEKLILYSGENNFITYNDVKLLVVNTESNIFELLESLAQNNINYALVKLDNLLLKENELKIISSLNSNIRYIYNAKVFYEDKKTLDEISKKLKKHPYILEKDLKLWKNLSLEKLRNILEDLTNIELKFKSERANPKLEFEKFIIKNFV